MATQTTVELQPLAQHQITNPTKPALPDVRAIEIEASTSVSNGGRKLGSTPPGTSSGQHGEPEALTPPEEKTSASQKPKLSRTKAWILIAQLCTINFISNFCEGLLIIGLPSVAADLSIPSNLLLWPNSSRALAAASCVLLAGSVADALGPRRVNVPGSFLAATFVLACGFSRSAVQLIVFRALQGVSSSLYGPSAISMMSTNIAHGRQRNIGFSSLFLMFPLGAGLGLVLGGVLVSTIGWRTGYYICGALGMALSLGSRWTLPEDPPLDTWTAIFEKLRRNIDWVGVGIAAAALSTLSYVLAMLSANSANIRQPTNIGLLAFSLALFPAFAAWMQFRTKRGERALIPNAMWKNTPFTSVCLMIALSNAFISCMSLFCSLFFQEIQHLTAIQAGFRILPQAIISSSLCILLGLYIHKMSVPYAVTVSSALCALAPLLMAITNPNWSYWYTVFWAQLLAPVGIDIMFTVGTLVVTAAFPKETQALASAVLSTFSQLGVSIGMCLVSVMSQNVTLNTDVADKKSSQALLPGYRASFWTLFAWTLVSCVFALFSLRKVGKVGTKKD